MFAALGFSGCADAVDPGSAEVNGAPQQFDLQTGTLAAKSTDARLLNCHLEYETFSPTFIAAPAAFFETTFGQVENMGDTGFSASDGTFAITVGVNQHPKHNLAFTAQIDDVNTSANLSYIILPRPHVGGEFLFELGAGIAPVTLADGNSYDHLRAYCSIRNP
jgi:hypothetical protein